MDHAEQVQLPPLQRLAVAYAPARARDDWVALLALDRRFAQTLSGASEPMLAQIRLAWWRDTFRRAARDWPAGEPLLVALQGWDDHREALAGLADGWEAMVGEEPLPAAAFAAMADGRATAMAALANRLGSATPAQAVRDNAYRWAVADAAAHLSDRREREGALGLLRAAPAPSSLDRAMRPLAVLRVLAERGAAQGRSIGAAGDFLAVLKAGLFGR